MYFTCSRISARVPRANVLNPATELLHKSSCRHVSVAWGSISLFFPSIVHKGTWYKFQLVLQNNYSKAQFLLVYSDYLGRHKNCYKNTEVATQTAFLNWFCWSTYQIIQEWKVCCSCTLYSAVLFFKHFQSLQCLEINWKQLASHWSEVIQKSCQKTLINITVTNSWNYQLIYSHTW